MADIEAFQTDAFQNDAFQTQVVPRRKGAWAVIEQEFVQSLDISFVPISDPIQFEEVRYDT